MRTGLTKFMLLAALLPAASLAQQNLNLSLPDFGDPSAQYLSIATERRLGAQVQQRLRDNGLIIDDIQLSEYLNSVGQRIAAYADQTGRPYTFYWIDAPSINAFAAPGGFIGMHTGLLLATESEAEMAGVVAHEIAHLSQRHIARAYADAQRFSLPMAAAMLAAAAIAAADSRAGQAALSGAMALNAQRQINFTRANEREADRIGFRLLSQAGFDPNGMPALFARLQSLASGTSGRVPEYLLTHPLPSNRLADVQNRIDATGSKSRRSSADSQAYYLAKERARVLTTRNTSELIQYYSSRLRHQDYRNEQAERYGYALALMRAGRYAEAEQQVSRLRKSAPNRLTFHILEAEIALARGERSRAWALFEHSRELYPDDFSLAISYGRALATQGEPQRAMRLLEPYLKRRSQESTLYEIYAQAAQRAGDATATHAAMAEYYYLSGDLDKAIEQADLGLKQAGATPYQQARLQARLRQFKEENERDKR